MSDLALPGRASGAPRGAGLRSLAVSWLWGWLATAQLTTDLLLAVPYLVLLALLLAGAAASSLLVGVPLAALALWAALGLGRFERVRLAALTGVVVPTPVPPPRDQPTWRRLLLDGRPWRATLHLLLVSLWGLVVGPVSLLVVCSAAALAALPVYRAELAGGMLALPGGLRVAAGWWVGGGGLALLLVWPLIARGLVGVDVSLGRWLLGTSRGEQVAELSARVQTLDRTRVETVDSVELERRRIERDLHDGPQQRLVAIAMDLGMARAKLADDPAAARALLDKAHAASKEAITEMRQVARGIHPPVLTDRGLDAALSALAARSPVPVDVEVDVRPRPDPTIEAIAYFCVSEALTNVAKHARAQRARVRVARQQVPGGGSRLVVHVHDDGVGGADPLRGTGLVGLRQRAAAVDGTVEITSPTGGPTDLDIRLPERQRTPKEIS